MTTLATKCPRKACKGRLEYAREDGRLQGTCISCARPIFRYKVDRTPVAIASAAEFSLLNPARRR